ncbi:MAG: alpha/beta fold hydrolase [Alphaproteobacteria bacterium]
MTRKTPLVLLPGLLLDGDLWQRQICDLAEIADIAVGDLTKAETMADLARAVLDAAPERFALAGLSMGGYVALEVMRIAPERITRLALIDTSARADSPERSRRRSDLLALAERGRFRGVTPALLPFYLHPAHLENAAITGPIFAMATRLGRDVFTRQTRAVMTRPDYRPGLPKIACPTLVLCGREDQATPLEHSVEMAETIPDADLVVLGRCGHLAPLERPGAVSAALRSWLER